MADKLIRIDQIIGNAKKGIIGMIQISRSSWWAGVASHKFPQPIKMGSRTTCWRLSDIERLINEGI